MRVANELTGETVDFPDDTPPDTIRQVMGKHFPAPAVPAQDVPRGTSEEPFMGRAERAIIEKLANRSAK